MKTKRNTYSGACCTVALLCRLFAVKAPIFFLLTFLLLFLPAVALALESGNNDPYHDTDSKYFKQPLNTLSRGQCTWNVNGLCQLAGWTPDYLHDADGWYNGVTNGSSKDLNPSVGSVMCIAGHVAYVVAVIDNDHWIVTEYNYYPAYQGKWDRQLITRRSSKIVSTETNPKSRIVLYGFIHPPKVANGLYRASNESTVFAVDGNVRRAISTAECFEMWFGAPGWGQIQVVEPAVIYERTYWAPPIPFLALTPDGSVYWIPESFNVDARGRLVARAFNNAPAFLGMGFSFDDCKRPIWSPSVKFGRLWDIPLAEPYPITTDGPYVNRNSDGSYSAGFRVRNLSRAGFFLGLTVRMVRSDGAWYDFPWSSNTYIPTSQEFVWWSSRKLPSGSYTPKVISSYMDSGGHNVQQRATGAGLWPYPDSRASLVVP